MANVKLKDASGVEITYNNVDTVTIPNSVSGNSTFVNADGDNAIASDILSGKTAHTSTGAITGTMPNNGAVSSTIASQGGSYTVPAGYHDGTGTVTANINDGTITSGAGSATVSDPSYNSTSGKFDQTVSGTVAAPTVGTAGYVSLNAGTKNTNTVSGAKSLAKVGTGVDITGTSTTTPSIARQAFTISGVTDAASGSATTTAPTSGVYVKVNSAANTGTLTATPKVTSAGYGTTTSGQYGATAGTKTVGANASADTYVPIKTGSATTPATTKAQSTPSISVSSAGLITASVAATSVSVTPTVSEGYVKAGTAGTVTMSASSATKQLTTKAATTYNTSASDQTIAASTYLTGAQTIKAVTTSNISAANIKAGTVVKVGDANSAGRIANVTGTFTSDATATAAQIRSGKTAYVNGSKITGTLAAYDGSVTIA